MVQSLLWRGGQGQAVLQGCVVSGLQCCGTGMYRTEVLLIFNLVCAYIENCDTVLCSGHPLCVCVYACVYTQSTGCNSDYI